MVYCYTHRLETISKILKAAALSTEALLQVGNVWME